MSRFIHLLSIVALTTGAGIASAQRGAVSSHQVVSRVLGRARQVWVYTPPAYSATAAAPYDLIVAFDGADYQDAIPLPRILDSLLAARAAGPFVAVLVDNAENRLGDLANQPTFIDFLASDLVPWIRSNYHVTRDPKHVIITGSSAGGLGASFAALRHPELFGKVLSQSGAYWRGAAGSNSAPYEWLTEQFRAASKRDLTFLLDVGDRETVGALGGAAPSIRDANRHLRDVLREKGYAVTYTEVPGGVHRPEDWKLRIGPDIVALTRGTAP